MNRACAGIVGIWAVAILLGATLPGAAQGPTPAIAPEVVPGELVPPPVITPSAEAKEVAVTGFVTGMLTGRVIGPDGAPIPGVTIEVHSQDTGRTWTVVTTATGEYRLPSLPVGRYRVRAMISGFAPVERTVTVPVGQATSLEVRLGLGPEPTAAPTLPPPPPQTPTPGSLL